MHNHPTYEVTAGHIAVNGTRLYYEMAGSGPAVVMIHAGIADHRMWNQQLHQLAHHYQVVRYDMRGFGFSDMPEVDFAPHEDLAHLLDALSIAQATLVGCSIGGTLAIDTALAYPDRVAALVPIGAAPSGFDHEAAGEGEEAISAYFQRISELYRAGDKAQAAELTAHLWYDGLQRSPEEVEATTRAQLIQMLLHLYELPDWEAKMIQLAPPAIDRLGTINQPTLVIVGEEDLPNIVAGSRLLAAQIPKARLELMADTAHMPNMEQPERFNRLLLDFLAGALRDQR